MAPPKAKRSRQSREETSVAREENEPTSSRRSRSTRATTEGDGPMGTSVSEARSPPDAAEPSGARRIQTRSSRGCRTRSTVGSPPATSARTRPMCANPTAATQTDGPAGGINDFPTGSSMTSNRLSRSRRSSSFDSAVGRFSSPNMSDGDQPMEMDAERPRRRAATQRPRPQSNAQQTPVPRSSRDISERAARVFELERRRHQAAANEARRAAAANGAGRNPGASVDIAGLMDEIANNLTPHFFDQLMDEGAGAPVPRTFRFQRDATNGRLNLVRNPDEAGTAAARSNPSTAGNEATGGEYAPVSAAAAMARAIADSTQPGTVTTVRLDLQIDVVGLEAGAANGGTAGEDGVTATDPIDQLLGELEGQRRGTVQETVEEAAHIRLDELTAGQVQRIVSQMMHDGAAEMVLRRRARNRAEREARTFRTTAAAEAVVAADIAVQQAQQAFEAAVYSLNDEARLRRAADRLSNLSNFPLMRERRSTRLNTRASAAEAASLTVTVPPAAADVAEPVNDATEGRIVTDEPLLFSPPSRSASSSIATSETSQLVPSPDSNHILRSVREAVIREMVVARREREDAAAAERPSTPPAAAGPSTTMRPLRNEVLPDDDAMSSRITAPMLRSLFSFVPSPDQLMVPAPPSAFNNEPITPYRIDAFITFMAGLVIAAKQQANDSTTRHGATVRGGLGVDRRIRNIIDACNVAMEGIAQQQNMETVLLDLLRTIVDNVNNVERDQGETRNPRRRIITFHMRPVTGAQGTTLRTMFGDLLSDGRGEADPSEQRLREQEDAQEAEDSTFSSAEWGECRICMADEPSNPMGCKHCRQLVGCNKCCNRWHRAGRRPTSSIIDSLFASFRADRERFDRIDEHRRAARSTAHTAGTTPPTLAASAAAASVAAGAGDAPPPRSTIGSTLRNSMLAEAWESNCPLCRKAWRSKPNVVPMQRCRPLGEPLDEQDRTEASTETEAVQL